MLKVMSSFPLCVNVQEHSTLANSNSFDRYCYFIILDSNFDDNANVGHYFYNNHQPFYINCFDNNQDCYIASYIRINSKLRSIMVKITFQEFDYFFIEDISYSSQQDKSKEGKIDELSFEPLDSSFACVDRTSWINLKFKGSFNRKFCYS